MMTKHSKKILLSDIKTYIYLTVFAISRYTGNIYFEYPINNVLSDAQKIETEKFFENKDFIYYLLMQIRWRLLYIRVRGFRYTLSEFKELNYYFQLINYISGIRLFITGEMVKPTEINNNQNMKDIVSMESKINLMIQYIQQYLFSYKLIQTAKWMESQRYKLDNVFELILKGVDAVNQSYIVLTMNQQQQYQFAASQYFSTAEELLQQNVQEFINYPQDVDTKDFRMLWHLEAQYLADDIVKLKQQKIEDSTLQYYKKILDQIA